MAGKSTSSPDLTKQSLKAKIDPSKAPLRTKLFFEESASPKPDQAGEGSTKRLLEKNLPRPDQAKKTLEKSPLKPAEFSEVEKVRVAKAKSGEASTKQASLTKFMQPRQTKEKPASLEKSSPPPMSPSKSSEPSVRVDSITDLTKAGEKKAIEEKGSGERRKEKKKKSGEKRSLAKASSSAEPAKEAVSPSLPQEWIDQLAELTAFKAMIMEKEAAKQKKKAEKKKAERKLEKSARKQRKEAEAKEKEEVIPEASAARESGEKDKEASPLVPVVDPSQDLAEGRKTEEIHSASVAEVSVSEATPYIAQANVDEGVAGEGKFGGDKFVEPKLVTDDAQLAPGQTSVDATAKVVASQPQDEVLQVVKNLEVKSEPVEESRAKDTVEQAVQHGVDARPNIEIIDLDDDEDEEFASPREDLPEQDSSELREPGDDARMTPGQPAANPEDEAAQEVESRQSEFMVKASESLGDDAQLTLGQHDVDPREEQPTENREGEAGVEEGEHRQEIVEAKEVEGTAPFRKRRIKRSAKKPSPKKRKVDKGKGILNEAEGFRQSEEMRQGVKTKIVELQSKPFIQEHGFDDNIYNLPDRIVRQIELRGWEQFVVPNAEARRDWVIEFYASLDRSERTAVVQGRTIFWAPNDWNESLDIHEDEEVESDYEKLLRIRPCDELEKCLEVIGVAGAKWEEGPQKSKFLAANLNDEARIWASFIRFSLMPTTHDSTMTQERALLIFAIMAGYSVNVGRVIVSELSTWTGKRASNFFYPHMISNLCAFQGVKKKPCDAKLPRKKPISTTAKSPLNQTRKRKLEAKHVESQPAEPSSDSSAQVLAKLNTYFEYVRERDSVLQKFFDIFIDAPTLPKFPDSLLQRDDPPGNV